MVYFYAAMALASGALPVISQPLLGMTIVFSGFTVVSVIRDGQETLKKQITEIAQANFDRHHEESLK